MIYDLKDYQKDAVKELKELIKYRLNSQSSSISKEIVFKAPTGSGKTYIVSCLLEELVGENKEDNFCMMWACPGTGELHKQTYDAVKEYNQGNPYCSLMEGESFIERDSIKKHEILFINWESVVNQDKDGQWINKAMKNQEQRNLRDILNNTRIKNRKIILIVDESHIGSDDETRIQEFIRDVIKPDLSLEMSATPKSKPDYTIDHEDVIAEGMIKKEIIINPDITREKIESMQELDSQTLILEMAYKKRLELYEEMKRNNSSVNPLVLIQISDATKGDEKKEIIVNFLKGKGITKENGKLKMWFSTTSRDLDKKAIKKNDDLTEFLVFKTAISTGWDCPRAHILVKFRETKSETFETQTIGRILRTPEAKHYNNVLDYAYIYTNSTSIITKTEETWLKNRVKELESSLTEDLTLEELTKETKLISYYRSRQGFYNDLTSRYQKYFEEEFMKYFDLTTKDKYLYDYCEKKLLEKGINLAVNSEEKIIQETSVDIKNIDKSNTYEGNTLDVRRATSDINSKYYDIIRNNLNGLAYARSAPRASQAITSTLSDFYGVFDRDEEINNYQKIVVNNEEIFSLIINNSTKKFKEIEVSTKIGKTGQDYLYSFELKKHYTKSDYRDITNPDSKSLYKPLYVLVRNSNSEEEKVNRLEENFVNYLDREPEIDWYYKNESADNVTNFGISYNDGLNTFRPDFIVRFKNGNIGIFDTKPIDYNVEDTKIKAEALYKYIRKMNERTDAPYLVGGIVISENYRNFYYYCEEEYYDFNRKRDNWWPFNKLWLDPK